MKKTLTILMAMVLAMTALAGCSSTNLDEIERLKVGVIQFAPHPSLDNCRTGFIDRMKELGHTEYKTIYDYQNANADMNLANTIAQKMASDKYDLIVGIATPAAQAAFTAANDKNIPVVFIAVSDPVSAGLADQANVTGVSDVLDVKAQVTLVKELLPEVKTLGVLYNTGEINSVKQVEALKAEAEANGYKLETATVNNVADVNLALESLLTKVDCLVNVLDNTVVSAMASIADKCAQKGIAIIGSEEEQVGGGALASNGFDYVGVGRQSAELASRMVQGETNIPYESAKDTQIVVNKSTADALNVDISNLPATAKFVD